MNDNIREFKVGDIVEHFKKEICNSSNPNMYTYEIIAVTARDTDNYERMVVYKALYDMEDKDIKYGDVFVRKYDEFISPVDKEKYPDIKREYRFQIIEPIKNIPAKYILTDDTIYINDKLLHRIKAIRSFNNVKEGDLGGYIQSEKNLSHEGNCWVYDDARVYGDAIVRDDATVRDKATVCEFAKVTNQSMVGDCASINGRAVVMDNAIVRGNAYIYDGVVVCQYAHIYGEVYIIGHSMIGENAIVCGKTFIDGRHFIMGDAYVTRSEDVISVGPILCNGFNDYATFYRGTGGKLMVISSSVRASVEGIENIVDMLDYVKNKICDKKLQ